MAAIPNLNTLKTGRGGPRRRGGRGSSAPQDNGLEDSQDRNDRVVQQTDYDAFSSRLSAVALGYLEDRYASAFLQPGEQIAKRYPIINRGTYVRVSAIDRLIKAFLRVHPGQRKQIISLGAGSDTRFWRLSRGPDAADVNVNYIELDFASNVEQKRKVIDRTPELKSGLPPSDGSASTYRLHALDLRTLSSNVSAAIDGLDPELPTLLLSECCLCYLAPAEASSVLEYFTGTLKVSHSLVLYEPIRPFDAFGRTMVSNLASRGIHMQTHKRFHSLGAERLRLQQAGFTDGQGARDVLQIWNDGTWTNDLEKDRVEKLEWLDEVEEWELLAAHYCVAWGWSGEVFSEAWSQVAGERTDAEARDDEIM